MTTLPHHPPDIGKVLDAVDDEVRAGLPATVDYLIRLWRCTDVVGLAGYAEVRLYPGPMSFAVGTRADGVECVFGLEVLR